MRLCVFLLCGLVAALGVAQAQMLVTAEDGSIEHLSRGYVYTLDPDPNAVFPVTPLITMNETGSALRLTIKADPGTRIQVQFTLPALLIGDETGTVPCSFATNGLYLEETTARYSPHTPVWLTTGAESTLTLHLGIVAAIPGSARGNSDYSGVVSCVLTDTSGASISTGASFTASVSGGGLSVATGEGYLDGLSQGYTYILNADPNADYPVTPVINGDEEGESMAFAISGDPGSSLRIVFKLPPSLIGSTLGVLPCSFPGNMVYVEETGERWDPRSPHTVTLGSDGYVTLRLGIRVTVPDNAVGDDEYMGIVACIVSDSGTSISASEWFYAYPLDADLHLDTGGGNIYNLSPGIQYLLTPDPGATTPVLPVINGTESGDAMEFEISGLPGMQTTVEFTLPPVLVGQNLGILPCAFAPNSVYLEQSGERWHPHQPHTFTLGLDGSATFHLGITVTIPGSFPSGHFTGLVGCQVTASSGPSVSASETYTAITWNGEPPLPDTAWVSFNPLPRIGAVVSMRAYDDDNNNRYVTFGFADEMHRCIVPEDVFLGNIESELPPLPPIGVLDARLKSPDFGIGACFGEGSFVDLRPPPASGLRDTFYIHLQDGSGGRPIHLQWPGGLASNFSELRIVDVVTGGAIFNVDMLSNNQFDLLIPHTGFFVYMRLAAVTPDRRISRISGLLHSGTCDSLRVTALTFTWDTVSHPVQGINWLASHGEEAPMGFAISEGPPLYPRSAHVAYRTFSGGGIPWTVDIDSLVPGQKYRLLTACDGVGVGVEPERPARFDLNQNYPNPFNPTTDIRFQISDYGMVTLRVYDVLGREVAKLVNEVKEPGTYTVRWDASGLSSGLYLYRLQAGDCVQTRKMMVIR